MPNFLEQLVSEWHEYNGYFVRRNVRVGKLDRGGFEGELDVVAFHPGERRLKHIECSTDALSWEEREKRFSRKFAAGERHIKALFTGFGELPNIEKVALFVLGSSKGHPTVGGGTVLMAHEFMDEIRKGLALKSILSNAVPEQFALVRALQFAAYYWKKN